jgi:purine-binding chemotaxis protein CheW
MERIKEVLAERAKEIAGRKDSENFQEGKSISIVEFLLAPEIYAFEEKFVSEVLFLKEITFIPGTPPFVMGVINLRGRIVSVINLKNLFNLKNRGLTELNKVMILKNEEMEFGIIADSILGNRTIYLNKLSQPPLNLNGIAVDYISGVTPDGLILLNANKLLSSRQIILNK